MVCLYITFVKYSIICIITYEAVNKTIYDMFLLVYYIYIWWRNTEGRENDVTVLMYEALKSIKIYIKNEQMTERGVYK